jgi:hypothetical protein
MKKVKFEMESNLKSQQGIFFLPEIFENNNNDITVKQPLVTQLSARRQARYT